MEQKKICRLFIAFFALLNIIFLLLYYVQYGGSGRLDEEFAQNVVKNLSDRGIKISQNEIVMKVPDNSIYTFEITDKNDYCDKLAKKLAGFLFDCETENVYFDVPDGISVSIYDKNYVDSPTELAKLLINPDTFYFQYTDSEYSLSEPLSTDEISALKVKISADEQKAVSDFANALCFGDCSWYITGSDVTDDGIVITLKQSTSGTSIDGAYMNVELWNTRVIAACGTWITEDIKERYYNPLLDGINVLYKLDLDNISAINYEKIVYSVRNLDKKTYYLLPVWEISCLDNNGKTQIFHIDALEE